MAMIGRYESYVELGEAKLRLPVFAPVNFTVPADAVLSDFLVRAVVIVDNYRNRFVGTRASSRQTLAWPRQGAISDGYAFGVTEIPQLIKDAQIIIALRIAQGQNPLADWYNSTIDGSNIKRSQIGQLSVEYFFADRDTTDRVTKTISIDSLLNPLLRSSSLLAVR